MPSWTATGLVPVDLMESIGLESQQPDSVAHAVGLFMADEQRDGQATFDGGGKVKEVEEAIFMKSVCEVEDIEEPTTDTLLGRLLSLPTK